MNLEELERLAREATPGPWHDKVFCTVVGPLPDAVVVADCEMDHGKMVENAAYIAACSPETVLRLVSIAKAAQRVANPQQMATGYHQRTENDAALAALRAALIPPGRKPA